MNLKTITRITRDFPFDAHVYNELDSEFLGQPFWRRAGAIRKAWQRELLMATTRQSRLCLSACPAGAKTMLWIYNWDTVGDSIMDLAVRRNLPKTLGIDLMIAPSLAPLFMGDETFNRICTRPDQLAEKYDFALLQSFSTKSLALKRAHSPSTPFASMFGHLRGERFDRQTFAQRRAEQLFGLPPAPPRRPSIGLEVLLQPILRSLETPRPNTRVAVALGARDKRRWYRRWPETLGLIKQYWPLSIAPPIFVLIGIGNAKHDLDGFKPDFLESDCEVYVDGHTIDETAATIAGSDAFLGADGGLMHMAVAFDKPGIALFVDIDPRMRLLPGTRLRTIDFGRDMNNREPNEVAEAFFDSGVRRA